jgi:hypothetical protein
MDHTLHLTPSAFATALILATIFGAVIALVGAIVFDTRLRARAHAMAANDPPGTFDDEGRPHRRRTSDVGDESAADQLGLLRHKVNVSRSRRA